jgi:hypothetical protein
MTEVELGTLLYTLVEPHRGHEVAYNRWYERDHFYAGCMVGPHNFAGRRFVATAPLKALREPSGDSTALGTYLALYWVEAGHHDDWNRWAVDRVQWLHANGRMFAERDHIHTALYTFERAVSRQADGVPPALALDHPYRGLIVQRFTDGDALPALPIGAGVGQTLVCSPLPLLADAPADVPRTGDDHREVLLLHFLDDDPPAVWAGRFAGNADTAAWSSPFLPTIPGTDTYTDQLW